MAENQFAEATIGYPMQGRHAESLRRLFNTPAFAVRLNSDTVGVEMVGALKNVASLGAGFCAGLGLGMNVKATVIRLSLQEIGRFCARFYGTEVHTLHEACGIGDLVLTLSAGRGQYTHQMR